MAFTSRWISALVIAGWNVVSLIFELLLYTSVHKYAHDLLANKLLARKPDERKLYKINYDLTYLLFCFIFYRTN